MMKRTLMFLLAGTALTLSAQQGTAWVAGELGQTVWRNSTNIKDSMHYGLGVGHWYTDRWGLDLRLLQNDMKLESNPSNLGSGKQTHLLASGLFNLRPGAENWYPYLAAGVGGTSVDAPYSQKPDKATQFNYHAGAGIMGKPAEHVLLDFGVKAVRVNLPAHRTDFMATLGLGYTWGGVKKAAPASAPEPAPAPAPAPEVAPEPVVAPVVVPVVAPPPPPPPVVEVAKPVPPPPAKIVLDEATLHFANGKSELGPDAKAAIQKVAEGLKSYPGSYNLVVSGHTSSVGSKSLNKSLSKSRADAVAKILVDAGIPAARITTVGAGPDKPLGDNKTKDGQAKNRRVEIDVKVEEGKVEVRKNETGVVEATLPAPSPRQPEKK